MTGKRYFGIFFIYHGVTENTEAGLRRGVKMGRRGRMAGPGPRELPGLVVGLIFGSGGLHDSRYARLRKWPLNFWGR